MKTTILIQILLVNTVVMTGCGPKEKTPDQIYSEQASGVALVLNEYYYSAELPDGSVIYFSNLNEGEIENIAFSEDSVKKSICFGSAFFIDNNGTLLTNKHVIEPSIDRNEVKQYMRSMVKSLTEFIEYAQEQMAIEYAQLENQIENNTFIGYDEWFGYYKTESPENKILRQQQKQLSNDFDEAQDYLEGLKSIDFNELVVKTHCEINIAYHDTYVTETSDFKPCVVTKTSEDNTDLALIRLKDKKTPNNAFVFNMPKDEGNVFGPSVKERETLRLNDQLVLIGYNHGVELASTREGIKAQLTTGHISQQPDDDRVMYTIPVLQGSSGSPVVNKWGELVAVNFAGINGTQSFNFGIPLKQIRKFLNS